MPFKLISLSNSSLINMVINDHAVENLYLMTLEQFIYDNFFGNDRGSGKSGKLGGNGSLDSISPINIYIVVLSFL